MQSLRTIESHFLYKQLFLCKNYHINCSKNKTMYELVLEFKNPIKNFYRRCSEYESVTQAKLYKSHFLYTSNRVSFSKHQYACNTAKTTFNSRFIHQKFVRNIILLRRISGTNVLHVFTIPFYIHLRRIVLQSLHG